MKQILILLLFCSTGLFAQQKSIQSRAVKDKDIDTLFFSSYERGEMEDFENAQKQLIKIYKQQDSLRNIFLQKFLSRNGVDLTRLSNHPDSLYITSTEIKYILKPKTK